MADEIKVIKTRLDYVEKEIEKSEVALDKRLHVMNEFRNSLKDQNNTFITRVEHDARQLVIENKVELLQKMVYVGLGIGLVLEIALKVLIK